VATTPEGKVNGKAFEGLYISMYASNSSEHVVSDISFGRIKTCDPKTKVTGGLILNCTIQRTKLSFINCYYQATTINSLKI